MSKTKILFISHSGHFSGAEVCLYTLLKYLDRDRLDASVVFPVDGPLVQAIESLDVRVYISPLEWWVKAEDHIIFSPSPLSERVESLKRIIDTERPDIIHTNTTVVCEGALAARYAGIPHVWHIHEILEGHPSLEPLLPFALLYKMIDHLSCKVVTVSDSLRKSLVKYIPEEKLLTIHNGIDPSKFNNIGFAAVRNELGISESSMIAVTVAQIATYKGIDNLLSAAAIVKANGVDIKFLLVGGGLADSVETLRAKIFSMNLHDTLYYLGERSDVPAILKVADLLVVPSLNESFSLVTAEAMAAGKPVITTNCGGPTELVIEGVTGYIVPVTDPQSLADKVLDLCIDKGLQSRMGEAAETVFRERFTAQVYADKFALLYGEMSGEGNHNIAQSEDIPVDAYIETWQQLSQQARAIAELKATVRDQQQTVRDQQQTFRERERSLRAQMKNSVQVKNSQIRQKSEEIDALRNSLSWRVTAPLRAGYSVLTGASRRGNVVSQTITAEREVQFSNYLLYALKPNDLLFSQAVSSKSSKYDVIVFPVIDWHFRIQRPQHLAKQLALMGHRVFYLSLQFNDEDHTPGFTITESPCANVFLVQLNCPAPHPNPYRDIIKGPQKEIILQSLFLLYSHCEIGSVVAKIDLPFWRTLAEALPGGMIVYDCMDHHGGFSTNTKALLNEEDKLIGSADLVITSSQRLSEIVGSKRQNTIIRNGAETSFFEKRPLVSKYSSDKPVVGYYGAISDWFDLNLVVAAAKAYPEWDFVLIGSDFGCDTRSAQSVPNIKLIGEVPYTDIPGWLQAFDVCIIPFKIVELTLCTNPVKVYEYLAAGKPVVATEMPELMLINDQVHLARNTSEFIDKLAVAMTERDDVSLARSRAEWARQHDWSSRGGELARQIEAFFPKVSIIVLTYNKLDLTRACLESLEKYTNYPDLELIIVDNASQDGSPEYLKSFAASRNNVKIILNDQNLGFAGGNNVGAKAATGEYLVILNNDTYVSHGWLFDLIRHLRRDEKLGIVGPVTNSIGNEAQIPVKYESMQEMQLRALEYTVRHSQESLYVPTVAFFCVALRRSTWETIGPLDEAFSVGFFEDDDYCRRLDQAVLKVAIAEDVFVHHQHSASFNEIDIEKKKEIFEKNKAVYESKWGTWEPHAYREQ